MRAISKNTRKVTALTLAAALVVAVYLNWQYARAGVTLEENAVQVAAGADTADEASAPILDGLMTEADEAQKDPNQNLDGSNQVTDVMASESAADSEGESTEAESQPAA